MKIISTEFQQNVGRYQDAALSEPVIITKNGRDKTVLISAAAFETLVKGRVARRMEDLDGEVRRSRPSPPPRFRPTSHTLITSASIRG